MEKIETIVDVIKNLGVPVGLLIYYIYKDNKFTEQLTKALTSIEESLEIIREAVIKGGKNK